jgi:hypothetical protein
VQTEFPPPLDVLDPVFGRDKVFWLMTRPREFLAKEAVQSGWTDDIASLQEDTAGAEHYIDLASGENAVQYLKWYIGRNTHIIIKIGCSSGLLLEVLPTRMPEAS